MSTVTTAFAADGAVLDFDAVASVIEQGLTGRFGGQRVLVLVPDHTRTAPLPEMIAILAKVLADAAEVDVMVALGTHPALSLDQLHRLVGADEHALSSMHRRLRLVNHDWQNPDALVAIGSVTEDEIRSLAGSRWHWSLGGDLVVRINRAAVEADHVVIVGPTFPHEVVGFSGGAKYLFPGISGPEMIDVSHWLGALCGVVDTIGVADTPTRSLIHRAAEFLDTPVTLVGLVVDGPGLAGVVVGDVIEGWRRAAEMSQRRHIVHVDRPMERVLSMAPPMYDELWTAAKAMYKLEPVLAPGAELIIHAPHLREVSRVHGEGIAAVGYHVLPYFLEQWDRFASVPRAVLAHSTHVRGRGTFAHGIETPAASITLASQIPEDECLALGLGYLDPEAIDPTDWVNREDEGVLVVPRAGETLYRVRP